MTVLWILVAIVCVACWVFFGLATFRGGHYRLFWIGFVFPILWLIGAFIVPTERTGVAAWARDRTSNIANRPRRKNEMDVGIQPWVVT